LTNKQKLADFLANPEAARLEKDPMYALSNDMIAHINAKTPELPKRKMTMAQHFVCSLKV
jgi:hypothetical protein